jgi:hypothetical protein
MFDHKIRGTKFSQLRNRHEAFITCTCGVGFSRWGNDKIEANAQAKIAIDEHFKAIRKQRLAS